METFTLSRKELHRPGLLKALCGGRLTNAPVAAALRITVRQVPRLKRRFQAGGPGALVHRNRDPPSPRRVAAAGRGAGPWRDSARLGGVERTPPAPKIRA